MTDPGDPLTVHSPPAAASPPGYQIEREIGRGGAAHVFLARDLKHDRHVALKVMRPEYADVMAVDRFLEEIHIVAALQHPHIVPLYDSGLWNGVPFYVMPYIEGESLRQQLAREGRLPVDVAVRIAAEIAEALEYAHRSGIIHRDVKPENVMLLGEHALVADFGIALAIHRASTDRLTRSGLAVGTRDYMSPEQASGDTDLDGRSDLYALGCVLFEMLAGRPVFSRETTPSGAMRFTTPPPSLRATRAEVPAGLDDLVHRALSPAPAERPGSAAEFLRELRGASRASASVGWRNASPARRGLAIAAAVAAVAALGVWGRSAMKPSRAMFALDQSAYAVFPFRHRANTPVSWLDGDGCARLLYDAMSRWRGVRLVNDMVASDVWLRSQPRTVTQVLAAAESLRAGQVAWGEVVGIGGDSIEIRATAYDVALGASSARQFVVRAGITMPMLEQAFAALADSVVLGGALGSDPTIASATRDVAAVRAYLDGRAAADRFDLPAAKEHFTAATQADAGFAHAFLWLARTIAWGDGGGATARDWEGAAERAVSLGSALPPRERAHARALLALSQNRAQDACGEYRSLIRADSLDFQAWLGLGECHARDVLVVPDTASPSGWSFRGSMHASIAAFRRAVALVPSYLQASRGAAYQRLTGRILHTDESRIRTGIALAPDTTRFGSFAALQGDTLAFTPLPYAAVISAAPGAYPPNHRDAIRWGLEISAQVAEDWVRAAPASADAHEARSNALERVGRLLPTGTGPSAMTSAREALSRSTDRLQRLRLATTIARLHLKTGAADRAQSAADSILRSTTDPTPREAIILAGLAGLIGQIAPIDRLSRLASTDSVGVPFSSADGRRLVLPGNLTAEALALMNLAAAGARADTLRVIYRRIEQTLPLWVPPADRAEFRTSLLREAVAIAYDDLADLAPRTARLDATRNVVLGMRYARTRGDTAEVRRLSALQIARTASLSPGRMGMNLLLGQAQVLLSLGDTAGATGALDAGLEGLARARPGLLGVVPETAAIPRAMLLRAELANQARDRRTARRWGGQAAALWKDADPVLAPLARRARALASE